MTRSTRLIAPAAVTGRIPFVVSAEVRDTLPGQRINVMLEQKCADASVRSLGISAVVADGDAVFVSFQLVLHERGPVVLMTTAEDDAGKTFHPDAAVVEVM